MITVQHHQRGSVMIWILYVHSHLMRWLSADGGSFRRWSLPEGCYVTGVVHMKGILGMHPLLFVLRLAVFSNMWSCQDALSYYRPKGKGPGIDRNLWNSEPKMNPSFWSVDFLRSFVLMTNKFELLWTEIFCIGGKKPTWKIPVLYLSSALVANVIKMLHYNIILSI